MNNPEATEEMVILVNGQDQEVGQMPKLAAHQDGLLHRAFSIFIFNGKGELLLQRRAKNKYHSPGLWTNTCCSHPRPNETVESAAMRRLKEEMGMSCDLVKQFTFTYKAQLENGLTEHELDHVFFGTSNSIPVLNANEADDWRYVNMEALSKAMESAPTTFTPWLHICLERVKTQLSEQKQSG